MGDEGALGGAAPLVHVAKQDVVVVVVVDVDVDEVRDVEEWR